MPDRAQPPTPHTAYTVRRVALSAEAAILNRRRFSIRIALVVTAVSTLLLLGRTIYDGSPGWQPGLACVVTLIALNRFIHNRDLYDRLQRLLVFYNRALARLDGTVPQTGHLGEEFRFPTHVYDRDLTILGPDSLFGLLATVRTGIGQRGLANVLLYPSTRDQTLARQQAIQELAPSLELREQIHLLGTNDFHQVAATFFDDWLDDPPPTFHPAFRYILLITSTLLLGLLAAGLWHVYSWAALVPNLITVFALQCALSFYLRPRVLPILKAAASLSNQMQMFEQGLTLLQKTTFHAPALHTLQQLSLHPHNAVAALKKVQSNFVVVEQRAKQWFLIASLLTCAGTHTAISIANWKRRHAAAMKQWLAAWAEFESLNALATYAYEHPANTYPEILATSPDSPAVFEATALAHPLLPPDAVSNDIALNQVTGLYIISGSNMAGKSTLLRAIGLNAVLAAAGAPIRATAARISPLAIGASIALSDSLAEGKSKFLAEVERLHAILKAAEQPVPVLFLIDEIFSGTNSLDRRIAAEAVATALIRRHAIGALSTHDLTLTEMAANPPLRAINLHMASPDPADPLAFDYRLKPGVNPSSNALAILHLIGIDTDINPPA